MTEQLKKWKSGIGKSYTDRNRFDIDELNKIYRDNYGISRETMNREFLKDINKDSSFLEVGAGRGIQLKLLYKMGYKDLTGIEPLEYARASANIDILEGDIFNLPFDDDSFDVVFTSAVLIHIHPIDIRRAINEVIRVSRSYIWGFEYYEKEYQEIKWRGKNNVLWKADFAKIYEDTQKAILLKESLYYYQKDRSKSDSMFMLEKI